MKETFVYTRTFRGYTQTYVYTFACAVLNFNPVCTHVFVRVQLILNRLPTIDFFLARHAPSFVFCLRSCVSLSCGKIQVRLTARGKQAAAAAAAAVTAAAAAALHPSCSCCVNTATTAAPRFTCTTACLCFFCHWHY